uniref:Uncharacterized protein n=1 Tax=Arundo donax TaxID=35708 RepID=A0A0A9BHG9_ARUDO
MVCDRCSRVLRSLICLTCYQSCTVLQRE